MTYIDPILMDFLSSRDNTSEMPQITITFNELLIKATYHNNYELVSKLIECDEFDENIIHDIGLFKVPCPLYYITMCYKRTMWGDFRADIIPFVKEQRKNIDKLLQLWGERFGVDVDTIIDYKKYEKYFHCYSDDESDEYVLMDPREKYTENGCREIDLDLFMAVVKFQFSKVKELLEIGANPNARLLTIDDKELDYEDYLNCLERIGDECDYICIDKILPILEEAHGAWYINWPINDEDIGHLIGWAAHEDMYQLLEQYVKTEES